jgi:hypothetical protein
MEDSPRTPNKLLKNCIIVYIGEQNIGTAVVCILKAVLKNTCTISGQDSSQRHN